MQLRALGAGFVSLSEALDLTTPAGRAMAGLLATFLASKASMDKYVSRAQGAAA
ncbi:MAG: hypothetical protein JOZ62_04855 [Acidobacteriaceae bacterium]|nr:hypothetical protein [Acidobacteriaceae bacterium]